MDNDLSGVHASPNIQNTPDVYEIENRAADPEGFIEEAMYAIAPWDDKLVLDLGAGTGFHIARFHAQAKHVVAVEPNSPSRLQLMARVIRLNLGRVSIMHGSAEHLLLPDASIDITHARFAYFFAPDCEPGLKELAPVMKPGGTAFIIDNDLAHGTFASWLQRVSWLNKNATLIERFWRDHDFSLQRIPSEWRFANRADMETVIRIEFPGQLAEQIIKEHKGTRIDYHYNLYYRRY